MFGGLEQQSAIDFPGIWRDRHWPRAEENRQQASWNRRIRPLDEQPVPTLSRGVACSPLSVAMNGSSNSSLDSSAARAKAGDVMPLPAWARAYVYGIQGFVYEVVFTALFDFLFEPSGNPTLRGCSTVASFFIYGLCGMLCEQAIFLYCRRRGYSMVYRLPLYVLTIYTWEFTCGLLLRLINACSWDYSHYPLNFMGLVTLTYAPLWVVLCLFHDMLYQYIYRLHIHNKDITFKTL
ncbi:transmembrane protein 229A-like isoform X2 [Pomacea canaliculata]|uniref:transmembrane protein 229A-like isoform X2 n=1 Tax=Pomacea canaliculata TaxID=400727 RepID=UPI000D73146A|nr:transmembrane protein 229A-like isoform X2 [Pomacea canaliculata]